MTHDSTDKKRGQSDPQKEQEAQRVYAQTMAQYDELLKDETDAVTSSEHLTQADFAIKINAK